MQREMRLQAGFLEVGLPGHGAQRFYVLINTTKLLSKANVALHSCRQPVNACFPTFRPIANTGWCQAGVLGIVEGTVITFTCRILIFSEFFVF